MTTQLQILKLIRDLQQEDGADVLFITHDFGVVAEIADHVIVLRQGEVVATGYAAEVIATPQHPYTRNLLSSIPGRTWTPPFRKIDAA